MRRSSRLSRVVSFGAVAAFVSISACSIFSGSDDSNGASSGDAGDNDVSNGSGRDASTRRDSSADGGGSIDDSGSVTLPHDDAGHVILPDGGTLVCDPQPIGSFSGGSYSPPVGPHANVCTSDDITNYTSCLDGADSTQCAQFVSGGSRVSCGSCLLTTNSAGRWGATIGADPASSFLNISGCLAIAFSEGTSATGCAGHVAHAGNCEETACDPDFNCAGATSDDYNACTSSAASGECASYESAAQTACDKDAGGADSVCSVSDTTSLSAFLTLFCGE